MGTEDERWSQTPGLLPGLAPRTRSQGPTQNKGGREAGLQQEECDYLRLISVQHEQCLEEAQLENETAGCGKMWDNLTCWPATPRGQVVVLACPLIFKLFSPIQGRNVSRSCTEAGWTPLEPGPYPVACGLDDNSSSLDEILTPLPLAAADSVLQFCEDRLHHRLQLVPRHSPGRHGHPEPVQEAPLHTELHPYAPLHILHPEGRRRLHQRLGPLQQWGDGPLLQGLGGLQGSRGLIPVLCHGQLLLAAGGGPLPAHPARRFLLLRAEVLLGGCPAHSPWCGRSSGSILRIMGELSAGPFLLAPDTQGRSPGWDQEGLGSSRLGPVVFKGFRDRAVDGGRRTDSLGPRTSSLILPNRPLPQMLGHNQLLTVVDHKGPHPRLHLGEFHSVHSHHWNPGSETAAPRCREE
ncbi:vasoactive intestinal polypeptide receptor 1 isoform X9 [Moschus berezovskii]|uniref:vasoactive intestinal polypeptide receptor 1 isoform X9 n=1 Tax=Moschus berezovskii TaxID=68408 RepID=UPI0024439CFF|nr:vasoactive intestinal polypeptide receptor 1 isoform X9 [Moschus berezovskii]